MVIVPPLLSTRPRGIVRELAQSPEFQHSTTLTRISCSDLLARDCRSGCGDLFVKLAFRSPAPVAPRRGPARAVRMSSAEQPAVESKDGVVENATKTVNVIIKGKVQGVFYRNWTVESAQQLGVNGWVRNLKDGSVEAVFSGKSAAVDSLIQKCYTGPSAARVTSVDVSASKDEVPQGFERKPSIW